MFFPDRGRAGRLGKTAVKGLAVKGAQPACGMLGTYLPSSRCPRRTMGPRARIKAFLAGYAAAHAEVKPLFGKRGRGHHLTLSMPGVRSYGRSTSRTGMASSTAAMLSVLVVRLTSARTLLRSGRSHTAATWRWGTPTAR